MRSWDRYRRTVTVWLERYQAGSLDEYGNPGEGYKPREALTRVVVAPGRASETDSAKRDNLDTVITLYCPPDTSVTAKDRLTLPDGTIWQVTGKPATWVNPYTSQAAGIQVEAEKREG